MPRRGHSRINSAAINRAAQHESDRLHINAYLFGCLVSRTVGPFRAAMAPRSSPSARARGYSMLDVFAAPPVTPGTDAQRLLTMVQQTAPAAHRLLSSPVVEDGIVLPTISMRTLTGTGMNIDTAIRLGNDAVASVHNKGIYCPERVGSAVRDDLATLDCCLPRIAKDALPDTVHPGIHQQDIPVSEAAVYLRCHRIATTVEKQAVAWFTRQAALRKRSKGRTTITHTPTYPRLRQLCRESALLGCRVAGASPALQRIMAWVWFGAWLAKYARGNIDARLEQLRLLVRSLRRARETGELLASEYTVVRQWTASMAGEGWWRSIPSSQVALLRRTVQLLRVRVARNLETVREDQQKHDIIVAAMHAVYQVMHNILVTTSLDPTCSAAAANCDVITFFSGSCELTDYICLFGALVLLREHGNHDDVAWVARHVVNMERVDRWADRIESLVQRLDATLRRGAQDVTILHETWRARDALGSVASVASLARYIHSATATTLPAPVTIVASGEEEERSSVSASTTSSAVGSASGSAQGADAMEVDPGTGESGEGRGGAGGMEEGSKDPLLLSSEGALPTVEQLDSAPFLEECRQLCWLADVEVIGPVYARLAGKGTPTVDRCVYRLHHVLRSLGARTAEEMNTTLGFDEEHHVPSGRMYPRHGGSDVVNVHRAGVQCIPNAYDLLEKELGQNEGDVSVSLFKLFHSMGIVDGLSVQHALELSTHAFRDHWPSVIRAYVHNGGSGGLITNEAMMYFPLTSYRLRAIQKHVPTVSIAEELAAVTALQKEAGASAARTRAPKRPRADPGTHTAMPPPPRQSRRHRLLAATSALLAHSGTFLHLPARLLAPSRGTAVDSSAFVNWMFGLQRRFVRRATRVQTRLAEHGSVHLDQASSLGSFSVESESTTGGTDSGAESVASHATSSSRLSGRRVKRRTQSSVCTATDRAFDPVSVAEQSARLALATRFGREPSDEEIRSFMGKPAVSRSAAPASSDIEVDPFEVDEESAGGDLREMGESPSPPPASPRSPSPPSTPTMTTGNSNGVCVRCTNGWSTALFYRRLLLDALLEIVALREGTPEPSMGCIDHILRGKRLQTTRACLQLDWKTQQSVHCMGGITVEDARGWGAPQASPDQVIQQLCAAWVVEHVVCVGDGLPSSGDSPQTFVPCTRTALRSRLSAFVFSQLTRFGEHTSPVLSSVVFDAVLRSNFGIDTSKPAHPREFEGLAILSFGSPHLTDCAPTSPPTVSSVLAERFENLVERKAIVFGMDTPVLAPPSTATAPTADGGTTAASAATAVRATVPQTPRPRKARRPERVPPHSRPVALQQFPPDMFATTQSMPLQNLAAALLKDWTTLFILGRRGPDAPVPVFMQQTEGWQHEVFRSITREAKCLRYPEVDHDGASSTSTPCVLPGTTKRVVQGQRRQHVGTLLKQVAGHQRCPRTKGCIRPSHFVAIPSHL